MFSVFWVGVMPEPVLIKRSSSNFTLKRARALLTAGWVIPTTSAAFVRLPSVYIALRTTKRFKSNELIFIIY